MAPGAEEGADKSAASKTSGRKLTADLLFDSKSSIRLLTLQLIEALFRLFTRIEWTLI